jgi:cobalt-zinc-cadmium efflux system outer membrane protein
VLVEPRTDLGWCRLMAYLARASLVLGSGTVRAHPARVPPAGGRGAQPLVVRLPEVHTTGSARLVTRQTSTTQVEQVEEPSQAEIPPMPESVLPGPVAATPGTTLGEVTQLALGNSPALRESRSQAAAARGKALQAGLYPNPTIGHASPQLAGDQTQYNAYVIQDLVTKGKICLDAEAAERAAREAELAFVRATFDVLTAVRQRFYTALATQQRVEILESMVSVARQGLETGEQRLKANVGTLGDVLLLKIELSKADVDLQNAKTLLETSRRQLAASTGLIDLAIGRLEGDLKLELPAYEVIAVQQGVLERNALVRSAEVEIGRSQILLRRAEVEPFPNINMMGGYQNQQPGAEAPLSQGMYQVQMVIPLWNRNQGNIRAAQANVAAAAATFGRVRTDLANDAAAAIGRYLTAQHLVDRYEEAILPSAVEVQSLTKDLHRRGEVDFLRYLAAQRALLDASLAYINAQESRWLAAAEVAGLLQSETFP